MVLGITYISGKDSWYFDLRVDWWENMHDYFKDYTDTKEVNTIETGDKYAYFWNLVMATYSCCGIAV